MESAFLALTERGVGEEGGGKVRQERIRMGAGEFLGPDDWCWGGERFDGAIRWVDGAI